MGTVKLKQNLVNLIDDKVREDEGDSFLVAVNLYTSILKRYIAGDILLTDEK